MVTKALIGLLLVLSAALAWVSQKNETLAITLGEERQSVATLNQAVIQQTAALMAQREAREATERILADADRARRQHQRQLAATQQQLTEALADETCADTALPAAALDWLRSPKARASPGDADGPAGSAAPGAAAEL